MDAAFDLIKLEANSEYTPNKMNQVLECNDVKIFFMAQFEQRHSDLSWTFKLSPKVWFRKSIKNSFSERRCLRNLSKYKQPICFFIFGDLIKAGFVRLVLIIIPILPFAIWEKKVQKLLINEYLFKIKWTVCVAITLT